MSHAGADAGLSDVHFDSPMPLGRDSRGSEAAVEAGSQDDAAPCSLPALPDNIPLPTHNALVQYDKFVQQEAMFALGFAFLDANGVSVFANTKRMRLTLDGELVSTSPNPPRPYDGHPSVPVAVAQAPDRYGVVVEYYAPTGSDYWFCVLTTDDWPADVTTACQPLPPGGEFLLHVGWDGTTFTVFGHLDETLMYARRYSSDGVLAEELHLSGGVNTDFIPVFLQESAVICRLLLAAGSCPSAQLNTFPLSFDPNAMQTWDLLPDDFRQLHTPLLAGNGLRAAVMVDGECFQRPPGFTSPDICSQHYPPNPPWASLLTIVDAQGSPVVLRQRLPVFGLQLAWDGANFVHMGFDAQSSSGTAWVLTFDAFDENGDFVMWEAKPQLTYSYPPHRLGDWAFVPVAPNDYIILYGLSDTDEIYIARINTVPM